MRKITPLRLFHCDVLVFDTIGAGWLHHCLPDDCNVATIDIRDRMPLLLDFGFVYLLFKHLLLGERITPGRLSYAWLTALFDRIAPRVILTCADNNPLLAQYAQAHLDVPVIFLQNALRDTVGSMTPGLHLPLYLSLGKVEANLFQSIGVQCQKYTPTGSVKLGLSIERAKEGSNSSFDLCFISHYRPELFAQDTPKHYPLIEKNQRILFEHISDYALTCGLSLAVISKTRETGLQLAEEKYFSTIAGTVPFKFIPADKGDHELDSYLAGLASGLVIHPASTLGFELFAAGKKVLFGASADSTLIQQWGIQHYFDALPDLVKLKTPTSDAFIKRCDQIRAMPDNQYREITQTAASTIVSMPNNGHPHETVKQLIYSLLA